jgi:hypothetical protein
MSALSTSISVDRSPETVFAAINDVRGWWSGDIEGDTDHLGAVFTYRYQDIHYCRQQITEFQPGRKIVWHVVDSHLSFVEDKTEWNGTDIVFEIEPSAKGSLLRFTHLGLTSGVECFEDCKDAWTFYVTGGLKDLILSKGA